MQYSVKGSELMKVLNVKMTGTEERTLVLSHGFSTDQSVWQKNFPILLK